MAEIPTETVTTLKITSGPDLEKGRRLARRRWARMSFAMLIAEAGVVFGMLLFSDDRAAISAALDTSSALLGMIVSLQVVIVLGYLGISGAEKILTARRDEEE